MLLSSLDQDDEVNSIDKMWEYGYSTVKCYVGLNQPQFKICEHDEIVVSNGYSGVLFGSFLHTRKALNCY